MFAPVGITIDRRADGSMLLRSTLRCREPARCVGEYLEYWGLHAPSRPFLLERNSDGAWSGLSYGEAAEQVRRIGAWLLERNPSERPVAILSGNSVAHGLIALAAQHVGMPVAPVSPAYGLQSKDFGKLKYIIELVRPGVIFVDHEPQFAPALSAIAGLHEACIVAESPSAPDTVAFSLLRETPENGAVHEAFMSVTPETVAKILFTSGSTGEPKGVINTQRMLCINQEQLVQVFPFSSQEPLVVVDWLGWHHTFGGNHNFNMLLMHGGTIYIDAGRPLPKLFDQTLENLRDVAPTICFNVPRGYAMLAAALRVDPALRRKFFSRLELIYYAAAALPQDVWKELGELAVESVGHAVPMVSSWGLTETAPAVVISRFRRQGTERRMAPFSLCRGRGLRYGVASTGCAQW